MVIRLSFVTGKLEGRVIQLPTRQLVSLGRTVRADISLEDDPLVSSRHCEIEHNGSSGIVRDLGSTNGTYLNGQAIREAHLRHNDRLRIGSTELLIEFDVQPAVTTQPSPAKGPPLPNPQKKAATVDLVAQVPQPGPIQSQADSSIESGIVFPQWGNSQQAPDVGEASQQSPARVSRPESSAVNPIMLSMDDSSQIVGQFNHAGSEPKPQKSDTEDAKEGSPALSWQLETDTHQPISPITSFQSTDDEHNRPPATQAPPASHPAEHLVAAEHRVIRALPPELTLFHQKACRSGISLFQTPEVELAQDVYAPSSLVDILAKHFAVMAVLHFQRAKRDTPEQLGAVYPLFDWLPEGPARLYGPILVDYEQLASTGNVEVIDQLWGHDGCLLFFGPDRQQLFEHVSKLIHRAVPGLSREGGLFHFCWPSVLGQLLENQSPEIAKVIFADAVGGVLTEIAMQSPGWQIFAPARFADQLCALGLQPVPPRPSTITDSGNR